MRTRMWRRWLNLFALVSLVVGIVGSSVQAATTVAQPELTLSGVSDLEVASSNELMLTAVNVPAETQITLTLPAGLTTDVAALNQRNNTSSEQFSARLEATDLLITTHAATTLKLAIPITAVTAGNYQLQATAGTLQSNFQAITTTETTPEASESTASSESTEATESAESTADATLQQEEATSETEANSTVVVDEDSTSTPSTPDLDSSLETAATTRATFFLRADQATGTSDIATSFYYGGDFTLSGTLNDTLKEKLTFVLVAYAHSGPGSVLQNRTLGTFNAILGDNQPWKYVVPDSYFPDPSTAMAGALYSFRIEARRTSGEMVSSSFKLAYIQGTIGITAPSQINFGNNLDVKATNAVTYMGRIPTGDKPLAVEDTRVFPAGVKINGWKLTASLTKQMTGETTGTVLTDSLHYLNNGTDYTLSSAASPVASLTTATPGKTTNLSDKWDAQNGLAFEPKPGQPKAEKYSGTVTWNLQETPPNS
ncbi:cell surface protein [Loigolactobacillus jiayinensis]|uniref:Cell surface protein n=1 Tax=Loigolactobacillus jiayinensis TaxID=2486016 RepID=A0ABW1RFF8_9LACO|nr:cell surface protein [Loigolactobacillus jiayinensis]